MRCKALSKWAHLQESGPRQYKILGLSLLTAALCSSPCPLSLEFTLFRHTTLPLCSPSMSAYYSVTRPSALQEVPLSPAYGGPCCPVQL